MSRRPTGVDVETRAAVYERAGWSCEICGKSLAGVDWSLHHRRPRQMGGNRSPWINAPTNLLLLCGSGTTGCHGLVESNRRLAYESGWLVRAGLDPAEVPVEIRNRGLLYLSPDGTYDTPRSL